MGLFRPYERKESTSGDQISALTPKGRQAEEKVRKTAAAPAATVVTETEEPEKIEYDLMKVLPKDHWILWNIHIITLGRTICIARRPKCCECFLREECPGREA